MYLRHRADIGVIVVRRNTLCSGCMTVSCITDSISRQSDETSGEIRYCNCINWTLLTGIQYDCDNGYTPDASRL